MPPFADLPAFEEMSEEDFDQFMANATVKQPIAAVYALWARNRDNWFTVGPLQEAALANIAEMGFNDIDINRRRKGIGQVEFQVSIGSN